MVSMKTAIVAFSGIVLGSLLVVAWWYFITAAHNRGDPFLLVVPALATGMLVAVAVGGILNSEGSEGCSTRQRPGGSKSEG